MALTVIWIIIHFLFAIAVYKDSKKIDTQLVGSFLWSLVTLVGGPLFAGVYWLVNRTARNESVEKVVDTY